MPDELAAQLPVLKDVLAAMNIPRYELDGWEADDLIGTIAARDTAAGWETVDRHRRQGLTPAGHGQHPGQAGVHPYGTDYYEGDDPGDLSGGYGFDPVHIVDLKALMGDTSDNIPGVKGIGEKTAMD